MIQPVFDNRYLIRTKNGCCFGPNALWLTIAIGSTPHSLITKHGEQFVRRALGYITASKTGLTKSELEDVLSCDDVVLADEVFKYHVPPIRRLPTLLWTRLRNDLGENFKFQFQVVRKRTAPYENGAQWLSFD